MNTAVSDILASSLKDKVVFLFVLPGLFLITFFGIMMDITKLALEMRK
jgi:hypothetical protein